MERAFSLVRGTNEPLLEIASKTGYRSPAHFSELLINV